MHSHWQILGIDPASASEKDAKIAYARLIRQHRPDTDPEGFQRVREAYEIGLTMLKNKASLTDLAEHSKPSLTPRLDVAQTETTTTATAQIVTNEPLLPSELTEAEEAVTRARATRNPGAIGKTVSALYYICTSLAGGRAGISLWQQSIHRVTDGRSELVAMGVSIPQLIAEVEAGMSAVTHACVGWWEKSRDLDSIRQLAEGILNEPRRLDAAEASVVALRLAMELAFIDLRLASKLTDFAFQHVDREVRESIIPQIDQQAELGLCFADFRKDQRSFWHRRFRRPTAEWSWTDPVADAAIEYLANSHERGWRGYEMIKQIAPANWFERLESALNRNGGSGHQPAHSANLEPATPVELRQQRRTQALWIAWAVSAVLLISALFLGGKRLSEHLRSSRIHQVIENALGQQSSLTAMTSIATPSHSSSAYSEGFAASQARVGQLRAANHSVETWANLLISMHRQALDVPTSRLRSDPNMETFRQSAQSLFESIAKSETDPTVEQKVLEFLLLDAGTPAVIKQAVVFRQQHTQVLATFLSSWELAARSSAECEQIIAAAATQFFANNSSRISVDDNERKVLMRLAHPDKTLSLSVATP